MMKPTPITPSVYVQTGDSSRTPETIVEVKWDESRVERKSFATLAEALAFAHSLCHPGEDDGGIVAV